MADVLEIAEDVLNMIKNVSPVEYDERRITEDEIKQFELMEELSESYRNVNLGRGEIVDLNDLRYQAAYLFRFFPIHCYSVKCGIKKIDKKQKKTGRPSFGATILKERQEINVCSIGGGPGTDVLGFYLYLKNFDENVLLNATVIDKHDWEKAWYGDRMYSGESFSDPIDVQYITYDINHSVTEKVDQGVLSRVSEADVILLLKFVSSVRHLPNFRTNLTEILKSASIESYIFYADNRLKETTDEFQCIAEAAGFTLIESDEEKVRFKKKKRRYMNEMMNDLEKEYGTKYLRNTRMKFILMRKY